MVVVYWLLLGEETLICSNSHNKKMVCSGVCSYDNLFIDHNISSVYKNVYTSQKKISREQVIVI